MTPSLFAPTPIIRERFRAILQSPEWTDAYRAMHPPRRSLYLTPLIYLLTLRVYRFADVLVDTYSLGVDGSATRRAYERLAETGVPLRLAVIMQNSAIRSGELAVGPAMAVGTFDDPMLQSPGNTPETDWVLSLMTLSMSKPSNKDERIASRAMNDEHFRFGRRDRVPPSLCASRDAWLFNIMLISAFAAGDTEIVALAEPGPRGSIAMIPPSVYAAT